MELYPGQRLGLTGPNGVGKSSLFAMITGRIEADSGDMSLPGNPTIAEVEQDSPQTNELAIDYVMDGDAELRKIQTSLAAAEHAHDGQRIAELNERLQQIDGYSAKSRAGRLLHGLRFSHAEQDKPINSFSGGWQARLNLAQALMTRSDLLLLDEPTNHLDLDALVWLESWLIRYQGMLLVISHDREFLDSVTTHTAHIENRSIGLFEGNFSAAERQRHERLAQQQKRYEKQQTEITHMQKFVDRFRYKASKARQAQSRLKALERINRVAPMLMSSGIQFAFDKPEKIPDPLVTLEQIDAGYDNLKILKQIRLSIEAGARIGLLGANGQGKSTLIKIIAEDLKPLGGERVAAKDLSIGYFAQHQVEQLEDSTTPYEHLQRLRLHKSEQQLYNHLGRFGFGGAAAHEPVGIRSGGERARLVFALLVMQKPNLLLLDEPTNHLDMQMRQTIATALQSFEGSMLVVAHDRHLLRLVCDELWLVDDGNVKPFDGDMDDYVKWLKQRQRKQSQNETDNETDNDSKTSEKTNGNNSHNAKQRRQQSAAERKALKLLQNKLKKLETEMEKLHLEKQSCEDALGDASIYAEDSKELLNDCLWRQHKNAEKLAKIERDWMQASEGLEQA